MNDVLISCFKAATETLNFTTAAQNVHISQPSFSRNIAMLEEELGFKLFLRSKQNGIRLTSAGAALYIGLADIEKRYLSLLERSRRISRGDEGKLVIGILNGICIDSLTFAHIKKFRKKYPNVQIELRSCHMADLERYLLTGVCDMCFMMANIVKERELILCEKIFAIPSYFIVPKSMGLDPEKEYSLADLKDQYFLLSDEYPEVNERVIEKCRRLGFEPKVKMVQDNETKMLWGELGEGVTGITMDYYIRNSEHIDTVRIKEAEPMDFSICWNKENYNPAIALFYSMIDEVFQETE